jgi:hypothetical protein
MWEVFLHVSHPYNTFYPITNVQSLFSETWLLPSRSLTMSQFKIYSSDHSDGLGGVAITVHNSFKSKQIPLDITTSNRFTHHKIDIIGIEVHLGPVTSPVIPLFLSIYGINFLTWYRIIRYLVAILMHFIPLGALNLHPAVFLRSIIVSNH